MKTNPQTIKKYGGYGVDANGDGVADPFDIEDAIYSAANYLSRAGASEGELKRQFSIIIIVINTLRIFYFIITNMKRLAMILFRLFL